VGADLGVAEQRSNRGHGLEVRHLREDVTRPRPPLGRPDHEFVVVHGSQNAHTEALFESIERGAESGDHRRAFISVAIEEPLTDADAEENAKRRLDTAAVFLGYRHPTK